jgi:hypothetical protein
MLTEGEVIEAVCAHLRAHGYVIIQTRITTQPGVDIIARRAGLDLHVEAKGETSSRPTSARFGNAFDPNQAVDHVGKAVLKALQALSGGKRAAIALPGNDAHRRVVMRVQPALAAAGVGVFWVNHSRQVDTEPSGWDSPVLGDAAAFGAR